MKHVVRWLALALAVALAAVTCTNPDRPRVQAETVVLPTPLQSLGVSLAATVEELRRAVTAAGVAINPAQRPYRPSEPQSLLQVPRTVLRADLADPDDGYVIVYQLADAGAAALQGRELADHRGSGFGQTNFSVDTQFTVRQVGDTVIFTSWSRQRSSDPAAAELVFDAVASVGQEIEVRK